MSQTPDVAPPDRTDADKPRAARLSKAARERQLLDTAEQLFTTRGYDATSIEDIARAAGVTRPIVYEHFGSREGVLLACVERARAEYERALAEAVRTAGSTDPAVLVERGSTVFFSLLERNPRRWALLFCSTTALSGELADRLTDLRFATVELIAGLVRAYAPQTDEERLDAFAHALSGAAMQVGRWWLRHPEAPRERIITYYRDFIVRGLGALTDDGAGNVRTSGASG
jgi:AcrR family transcriptional regulator